MTCTVKKKGKRYVFLDECKVLGTKSNRTIALLKQLTVTENNTVIYEMRQESVIKKLFVRLFYLLTRTQSFPEFIIYRKGLIAGTTKPDLLKSGERLCLDEAFYTIRLHSKNFMSVFKGDSQIALIKKSDITYANQNEYKVSCERELYEDRAWLMMLVMFVDTVFWNRRMQWDAVRWERTLGKERFPECIGWKPKEMNGNIKCPCCGNYTIDDTITPIVEICPVCYWQYDAIAQENPDKIIGSNKVSLRQARENYRAIGAICMSEKPFVRLPKKDELPK